MKKTVLIFSLFLISLPCNAQWRYILGNQQTAGSLFLAFGIHDSELFASSSDNTLRYKVNDGWSATGFSGGVGSFAFFGRYVFAGLKNGGGGFRSSDDGKSSEANGGAPVISNTSFVFSSGIATVFRSADSGNSWQTIPCSNASSFAITGTCILATIAKANINRSTDNGTTWNLMPTPPSGLTLSTYAVIGSQIFAGGTGLFRSTDSGASWVSVGAALFTQHKLYSIAASKSYLFAGTDSGVYLSIDAGDHWRNVSEGMAAHPGENPKATLLAVLDTLLIADVDAGHGDPFDYSYTAARSIPEMLDTTKRAVQEPSQFVGDTLMVYPNPLTGRVTVAIGGITSIEQVSVLNVLGVDLLDMPAGRHSEVTLDLSNLPSGTYFLRVLTERGYALRKIVKE